jgi:REP element-mobilizing transposase RayT
MGPDASISSDDPLAYLLTWTTYGTWLPGDRRGWTKRKRGIKPPDPVKEAEAKSRMTQTACRLDERQRRVVEATIAEHCGRRGWKLLAVNCRTNHIHVVVAADEHPDRVRDQMKALCTRRLRSYDDQRAQSAPELACRRRWWTQGGSSHYLNDVESVEAAILYVRDAQ